MARFNSSLLYFIIGILTGLGLGLILVILVTPFYSFGIGDRVELHLGKWHFHDSLYGIFPIIIALFNQGKIRMFLLGLGIGLILQHVLREGFFFVTPD